ncbi:polyprenol monophosphomannose synthase [Pontiella agarivorans]|uniref:Polyprenol monophosphomannose synthase n=1 Tax=Pontiella agarivorans TaxID=3038953 RepID=A0ABU5MZH5_9BACT|nr:polyprenol monophosphomannose synthase [Pontiella agarivorans]MDZ8119587.1 polyprenol monophosphomannose synthase [Pontiella agarivorans]
MNDIDTLVIIPTYNEKENINKIATAVVDASPHVHILFVDDNSPDGTGDMADALTRRSDRIHVLHRTSKDGLGRAYIAGFRWALERDYKFVMEMDCDFSHDPAAIPSFRDKILAGHDLVIGSRYCGGIRVLNWPMSRLLLSRGAAVYVHLITGMPVSDPTGGFKCFRREVLESYDFDQVKANGYGFQIEMTHKAWMKGFRIGEVPIVFEDRQEGTSKMSGNIIYEALWVVWTLAIRNGFRRKPKGKK